MKTRIVVHKEVLDVIIKDSNKYRPSRTGGILLGFWTVFGIECVVTNIILGGPNSEHHEGSFVPDYKYQENLLYYILDRYSYLRYIGNWVAKPFEKIQLEEHERTTLQLLSEDDEACTKYPIYLIMAGSGSPWRYVFYMYDKAEIGQIVELKASILSFN